MAPTPITSTASVAAHPLDFAVKAQDETTTYSILKRRRSAGQEQLFLRALDEAKKTTQKTELPATFSPSREEKRISFENTNEEMIRQTSKGSVQTPTGVVLEDEALTPEPPSTPSRTSDGSAFGSAKVLSPLAMAEHPKKLQRQQQIGELQKQAASTFGLAHSAAPRTMAPREATSSPLSIRISPNGVDESTWPDPERRDEELRKALQELEAAKVKPCLKRSTITNNARVAGDFVPRCLSVYIPCPEDVVIIDDEQEQDRQELKNDRSNAKLKGRQQDLSPAGLAATRTTEHPDAGEGTHGLLARRSSTWSPPRPSTPFAREAGTPFSCEVEEREKSFAYSTRMGEDHCTNVPIEQQRTTDPEAGARSLPAGQLDRRSHVLSVSSRQGIALRRVLQCPQQTESNRPRNKPPSLVH
eukprot:scaffold1243_cov403-Prasinococcus_capsulatus_cf.AAC.21